MEPKVEQFIDGELKKVRVNGFKYVGKRENSKCIFVFERQVDENDCICLVLDGESDRDVEIIAETSYNSGEVEFPDKLATLGSWKEAIGYFQKNILTLVKKAEKIYEGHKEERSKTASKIERIAKKIIAFDSRKFESDMKQMGALLGERNRLDEQLADIGGEVKDAIWKVIRRGTGEEASELLETLSKYSKSDFEGIPYFNFESIKIELKGKSVADKPIEYKGYEIRIVVVQNGMDAAGYQYVVSKLGRIIYDGSKSNSFFTKFEGAVSSAQEYVDKLVKDNGSTDKLFDELGIANAKYTKTYYEYEGKDDGSETMTLKNDKHAIDDFMNLVEKNHVTSAKEIKVLEKDTNGYRQIGPEYDTTRYTVLKGWYIRLKIGNDEWAWGAGNTR